MLKAEVFITDKSDAVKKEIDDAIERALEKVGLTAEAYAVLNAPVDTGRLRSSITHATDETSAYIGTNVEYAKYVELGTSKQKPQPYLRPAVNDHMLEYKQIFEKEISSVDKK